MHKGLKRIFKLKVINKKFIRFYDDSYKIKFIHAQFMQHLCSMTETQRIAILEQARELRQNLKILEKTEYDPSPFPTEEQYQQQFFENTGWFYPDEDYQILIKKGRK